MSNVYDVYKPTKLQVIVPIIVLAATLIGGGIMLGISKVIGVEHEKVDYLAPGTASLNLEAGNYTIYLMQEADYEGKHYSVPEDYAGASCKVVFNGKEVALNAPENEYTFGEGSNMGKTLKAFQAEQAGDYELQMTLSDESVREAVIAVGKTDEHLQMVVTLTVIAMMVMLMGVLQFAGYLILNGGKMLYYLHKKKMDF